jgi:hypothetical protein
VDRYKYLSPYRYYYLSGAKTCYIRSHIDNDNFGYCVYQNNIEDRWQNVMGNIIGKYFSSLEEAKAHLDKILLEEGFIFLTEEQWDKYKLLC